MTGFSDSTVDSLIDAQAAELDPLRRRVMVKEVAMTLVGDGVRFMPAAQVQAWSWWPRVRNLHINFANYEYIFWSRVWVDG